MPQRHEFAVTLAWTGNDGRGTSVRDFARDSELLAEHRPTIPGGPTPSFAGDGSGWSPEDLLIGAVAQCHMLWYLHLCARNGIDVQTYTDHATGVLEVERADGAMTSIDLRADVAIAAGDPALAEQLFTVAGEHCYIARSVNFPVHHAVTVTVVEGGGTTV